MIRLLLISSLLFFACKEEIERAPSSGQASVLVNQEQWESDVRLLKREAAEGWDIISLADYWSDGATKTSLNFALEFDLLESQSSHSLVTNIVNYPTVHLDSVIISFVYLFPEGDAGAAVYRVSYSSDLANSISFELDSTDSKLVTAKWSAELHLDESWRASAEAEGHPDTIRMENGTATFRLP